jgi:nitric oxide dioxygenase
MLQKETIRLIQESVPLLREYGHKITANFYKRMFNEHPELLNIFNHANQRKGHQQQALANAVYAAAANITQLEQILPTVKHIAHKHRSIGVLPEHYPIVGQNLLLAMRDVLQDKLTEPMLNAWQETYGVIADLFIQMEEELYQQAEQQPGGWRGFRDLVVTKKVRESEHITSFYLEPKDGQPLATFLPGQYISVKVEIPGDPYTHIRQYSLSDDPNASHYRITVKQEENGKVSTYLHQEVEEGSVLSVSAPAGVFTLEQTDSPVILLSAGVGLTPLLSMLKALAQSPSSQRVIHIHATHNSQTHALREEVLRIANSHAHIENYFCYSQPTDTDRLNRLYDKEGLIDAEWLKTVLPSTGHFYLCGPSAFMRDCYQALLSLGIAPTAIHHEIFGPAGAWTPPATAPMGATQ